MAFASLLNPASSLTPALRGARGGRPSRERKAAAARWTKTLGPIVSGYAATLHLSEAEVDWVATRVTEGKGVKRFLYRLDAADVPWRKELPSPEEVAFSLAVELRATGVRGVVNAVEDDPAAVRAMADRFLQVWPMPTEATRRCAERVDESLANVRLALRKYFESFAQPQGRDVIRVLLGDGVGYINYMQASEPDYYLDVRLDRRCVEGGFFRLGSDYYLRESEEISYEAEPAKIWMRGLTGAGHHCRLHHESGLFRGESEDTYDESLLKEDGMLQAIWQRIIGGGGSYDTAWSR